MIQVELRQVLPGWWQFPEVTARKLDFVSRFTEELVPLLDLVEVSEGRIIPIAVAPLSSPNEFAVVHVCSSHTFPVGTVESVIDDYYTGDYDLELQVSDFSSGFFSPHGLLGIERDAFGVGWFDRVPSELSVPGTTAPIIDISRMVLRGLMNARLNIPTQWHLAGCWYSGAQVVVCYYEPKSWSVLTWRYVTSSDTEPLSSARRIIDEVSSEVLGMQSDLRDGGKPILTLREGLRFLA